MLKHKQVSMYVYFQPPSQLYRKVLKCVKLLYNFVKVCKNIFKPVQLVHIHHQVLLHKISNYGFVPPVIKLHDSYLNDHGSCALYNGFLSYEFFFLNVEFRKVPMWVVFCSIYVFINDLLLSFFSPFLACTDDIKLYNQICIRDDSIILQSSVDNWVSKICSESSKALGFVMPTFQSIHLIKTLYQSTAFLFQP